MITHISDELGDEWALEEAERGFGGPVEIAARARCTKCEGAPQPKAGAYGGRAKARPV